MEVRAIWARNVNRLSLRLGAGWSEGFHRFLDLLSTSCGNGEYMVTPASLAKSGLKADLAAVIIGGFTRLDVQRLERLNSWVMATEVKEISRETSTNRKIRGDEVLTKRPLIEPPGGIVLKCEKSPIDHRGKPKNKDRRG